MIEIKEISKTEKTLGEIKEQYQNVYFLALELENVRCFSEKQTIDFSDGNYNPRQWTIILGENGTGKTTILQSIIGLTPSTKNTKIKALGYSSKAIHDGYSKWGFSRETMSESYLLLRYKHLSDISSQSSSDCIDFTRLKAGYYIFEGSVFSEKDARKFFNIGYGASRKAGKTSISDENEESNYETLFDETALLINPEEWLLQADYATKRKSGSHKEREEQLETVKNILIRILPDVDDIRFSEKERKDKIIPSPIVEFRTKYGWVEAKDLSLGYRTSMAWIVDFASRMFDRYSKSENPLAEPAVVLIDEIDLHLHPKWQRDLLPWLSDLFPNTQFIVTTHSPLIVQSAVARDANIVVCRREGDHVVIDQSVEAVKNWRADQILTSDLFGLETARPKEIEKFLEEKEIILSKAKLTKKDEKRLAELEKEIGFLPVSEDSEDNEAMEVIQKAANWIKTQAK